jgi:hypothetical protein
MSRSAIGLILVRIRYDFSLTPGLSRVYATEKEKNRFNGFDAVGKPLKRLIAGIPFFTRLKPGVDETSEMMSH